MKNEQNNEKSVKIDQEKHQKIKVIKVTKEYFWRNAEDSWQKSEVVKGVEVNDRFKIRGLFRVDERYIR